MTNNLTILFALFITSLSMLQAQVLSDTIEAEIEGNSYRATSSTPMTFQNLEGKHFEIKNVGQEATFILSQESPSITAYSDAGATQGYSYIRLRGIDQTRINMTLDGVPINEPEDQGAYFSNHPDFFNSISGMQIQRGVGISQNGTASYGGSMQFYSPNLTDSAQGSAGLGYGSFNSYRVYGEYQSGMIGKTAFYARASHLHSDGYKEHSDNTSQSIFLSGAYFSDKHVLYLTNMTGHQMNQMAWLGVSDSAIDANPRTNANAEQEKDNFLQSMSILRHKWFINNNISLQSALYYTFLDGNYGFDFNNFLGFPSTEELYNYAFRSHFIGLYSNFHYNNGNFKSTTGIHGNLYNRRHLGSEASWGELYRNVGYKEEASIFSKLEYQLNALSFFVDLQGRFTQFSYKDIGGTSMDLDPMQWLFFNPKGGLSYAPSNKGTFYYSIGRTGREPTRNDIFNGMDDLGDVGFDSLGNPLLGITEAEYVLDQELGYRHKANNWSLGVNAFFMQFQNEIVLNGQIGPNGLPLNSSFARSIRTGLEFQASWEPIEGLILRNNSSYNYSQISDSSQSFSAILTPGIIINQEVAYQIQGWEFSIQARYQSGSFIDFGNTEALDDYVLLNAMLGYRIKNWHFSLMGNNLLNTRYYNRGYIDWDGSNKYFIQAPINVYGAVRFYF